MLRALGVFMVAAAIGATSSTARGGLRGPGGSRRGGRAGLHVVLRAGHNRLLRTGDDRLLRTGDDRLLRTGDDRLLRTGDDRLLRRPRVPT